MRASPTSRWLLVGVALLASGCAATNPATSPPATVAATTATPATTTLPTTTSTLPAITVATTTVPATTITLPATTVPPTTVPPTTLPPTTLLPAPATTLPPTTAAPATAAPTTLAPPPAAGTASAALAALPVQGLATLAGYSRSEFGPAWADVDHNGCDTRNDILGRDLTNVTFRPGTHDCVVASGVLHDPYTATVIQFMRGQGTSDAVQIDHIVPLANAWQTGAQSWTAMVREDFANDPLELLAVDGPTNEAKGDDDASEWLPPNPAFRCPYVARQIAVKQKYHLWVTPAEGAAMGRVLATCPGEPLPTDPTLPAPPPPSPSQTPAPAPVPAPAPTLAPPAPAPAPSAAAGSAAPISAYDCPPGFPVKGNANSGIYHVPGGGSYNVTKPEICFATPADAAAAGFRAARN